MLMRFRLATVQSLPVLLVAFGLQDWGGHAHNSALLRQPIEGYKVGVELTHVKSVTPVQVQNGEPARLERLQQPVSRSGILLAQRTSSSAPRSAAFTDPKIPRTPDGRPNFQGTWLNNTATPLERPKQFADKEFFTEDEAKAYEKSGYQVDRLLAAVKGDRFELDAAGSDIATYEPGHVLANRRTSLIVDPTDGHIPALTPDAQRRAAERVVRYEGHHADGPENLSNGDRCLAVQNTAVPPLLPMFYNNHLQFVQNGTHVAIVSEMIHDARIIPLSGRPHLPSTVTQWLGDSVGHWEGDTLVVDTTNFTDQTPFRGSGPKLHLTERFTLTDPNTITYRFTVDDPESFVRSWSAESAFTRTGEPMFEYACHEGNYSMQAILNGARAAEKQQKK